MVVTDYNLFTTASTAYSLLLFDDRHLQEKSRFIGNMLDQADQAMLRFKKDEEYNFWLTRNYPGKNLTCPAPLNIPLFLIDFRVYLYKYTRLFGLKKFEGNEILFNWFRECYSEDKNPTWQHSYF